MCCGNVDSHRTALVLLSGLPGAGKTTFARALSARANLEVIESDAIRAALVRQPRYTPWEHARVFAECDRRASLALAAGRDALIDATNLRQGDRRRFEQLASRLNAQLICVRLVAPEATIRERLAHPRDGHSQADVRVFELLQPSVERFRQPLIVVDSRYPLEPALALVERLLRR
jgi:predicted kinase